MAPDIPLDAAVETRAGISELLSSGIGLVTDTEVLEVVDSLHSARVRLFLPSRRRTHLGSNAVEQLECDTPCGLVGDGDIKVCDGVGHGQCAMEVGGDEREETRNCPCFRVCLS